MLERNDAPFQCGGGALAKVFLWQLCRLYLEVEGDSASELDFVGVQRVAVEA